MFYLLRSSAINCDRAIIWKPILGDPGAVSGGGEKSERGRKKFGEKSQEGELANRGLENARSKAD